MTAPQSPTPAMGRRRHARHRPLDRSAVLLRVTSAGEMHKTITAADAERRYGGSRQAWNQRAIACVIRGVKLGRIWLLSEPDVRRFVVEGPTKDTATAPRKLRAPRKPRVRKAKGD